MIKNLTLPPKNYLTVEIYKTAYENLQISLGDPTEPFDRRTPGKLESILGSVQLSIVNKYVKPTVLNAAVAYFIKIACEHPLFEGNKRTAVLSTHVFLLAHGVDFTIPRESLYELAIIVVEANRNGITQERLEREIRRIFTKFSKELAT